MFRAQAFSAHKPRKSKPVAKFRRLEIERLEDRVTPSTFTLIENFDAPGTSSSWEGANFAGTPGHPNAMPAPFETGPDAFSTGEFWRLKEFTASGFQRSFNAGGFAPVDGGDFTRIVVDFDFRITIGGQRVRGSGFDFRGADGFSVALMHTDVYGDSGLPFPLDERGRASVPTQSFALGFNTFDNLEGTNNSVTLAFNNGTYSAVNLNLAPFTGFDVVTGSNRIRGAFQHVHMDLILAGPNAEVTVTLTDAAGNTFTPWSHFDLSGIVAGGIPFAPYNSRLVFGTRTGDSQESVDLDNINAVFTTLDGNQAPVADAGGPYSVPEGGSVVLDGTGSTDPDGTIVYEQTFDTDTTTTAQTLLAYPEFSFSGGTLRDVQVTNGVLHLSPQGAGLLQTLTRPGFDGDLIIDVDLGKNVGGPDFNVGLVIGANRLVFHPGLAGGAFPQGSFRVEGPGGFGNTDMGFVPAAGDVLHHMRVTVEAATGKFGITITDKNNSANVYQTSFTNAGYTPGSSIGFVTHGLLGDPHFARFDNLTVFSTIPDPSSLAYEWDFDYDGVTFDVDATGAQPAASFPDDFAIRTIGLRVTDAGGLSDIATTTLEVTNVAPAASIAGPTDGLTGETLTFTLGATDVSAVDQAADFTYDIDWNGDGIVDQTETGPASFSVDHVFADAGLATVIVTATDKDGGVSAPVNLGVNVIQPVDFAALPRRISLNGNGIFTVVIKSTADFDARSLDLASLRLSGVAALRSVYSDLDHDGDSDLILFFRRSKFVALYKAALADDIADGKLDSNVQAVDLFLTGKTVDGADVLGSQTVKMFLSGQNLRTVLHSLGFAWSNRQGRVRHR